jgi:hypothetical protein
MAADPARPVVIQTMWRTGGTYLSFALREQNPVALFYEPLHEDYSKYTQAEWDGFAASGAEVARGHPTKSFHYLTDYPFRPGAGVAGHRPEFAFRDFVLGEGDEAPELRAYIAGLLDHAAAIGRRPLFKFCRAFLRQAWLNRAFQPSTVYLARCAAGMAASYARIGGGAYFYGGFLRVLSENRAAPLLADAYCYVARAHPEFAAADEALTASASLAGVVSQETREDVFLFFWALALAAHGDPGVLILDAAAFGADARSRAESAAALRGRTGLEVDLADAVALDQPPPEPMRFRRPEIFAVLLREALRGFHIDDGGLPASMARQFGALVG